MRILRDQPARMRDAAVLRAAVYLPDWEERRPVLLIRTPYDKRQEESRAFLAAAVERGYGVAVQDVRGRFASDGAFDPYRQESADGFDSVEWAAAASWANGRVGMTGLSYPGAVQWLAAVEAPPGLPPYVEAGL